MTQYLLNAARTVIFSTAPAPPAVAAGRPRSRCSRNARAWSTVSG